MVQVDVGMPWDDDHSVQLLCPPWRGKVQVDGCKITVVVSTLV